MNWQCPYCHHSQIATDGNFEKKSSAFEIGKNRLGRFIARNSAVACLNPNCLEVSFNTVLLQNQAGVSYNPIAGEMLHSWQLLPDSSAKPQPEFIKEVIREDYYEACKIRDLSPKASATLARRCLQGMIRDFCGISKNRLIDEINELRNQLDNSAAAKGVTHESVDAIDAVRSVGNIGAHMERDVDLIVDIDPGEAQMLIDLIEMLFQEWYVEREKRTRRLAEITALSAQKASELEDAKLAKLGPGPADS